jgi:hypothetical protein
MGAEEQRGRECIMTRLCAAAAFCALLAAGGSAAAQNPPPDRAPIVQSLADCRKLTEDSARLACYDKAVAALDQAEARGDIVVVDRDQARKVRRQAFGLPLPSLSLFDKGESDEELNNMTAQVVTARQDGTGRWTVKLDSGATWTQVDTSPLRRTPRPGMPVTIRKAALGSFMMKIGDQHAVRAKRVE